MPRGRKKATAEAIAEELASVDARIAQCKQLLSELKSRRKELCAAKERAEMESLYAVVKASGKTPDEWLDHMKTENP